MNHIVILYNYILIKDLLRQLRIKILLFVKHIKINRIFNIKDISYECLDCNKKLKEDDVLNLCCPECESGHPHKDGKWWK